jgi:hypothetical protein
MDVVRSAAPLKLGGLYGCRQRSLCQVRWQADGCARASPHTRLLESLCGNRSAPETLQKVLWLRVFPSAFGGGNNKRSRSEGARVAGSALDPSHLAILTGRGNRSTQVSKARPGPLTYWGLVVAACGAFTSRFCPGSSQSRHSQWKPGRARSRLTGSSVRACDGWWRGTCRRRQG